MKPPIISDRRVKQANERVLSRHGIPSEPITLEDAIRIGDELRLKIIEEQGNERLQAQRDADVAWLSEEIEKVENPYIGGYTNVGFEYCRTKILSLLK